MEYGSRVARVMWLVLALNIAFAILKFVLAHLTQSATLAGDAYFYLVDTIVDVIILVSLRIAARPPDQTHPYGHGKFEAVAVAVVAVLIFAMLGDLVERALAAWRGTVLPQTSLLFIAVLAVTLLFNLALALFEIRAGRRLNSSSLKADGVYTLSGCTLTLLSIVSLFAARSGLSWPDALGASLASVMILIVGYLVARDALAALTDRARLDPEEVAAAALTVPGIGDCHSVRSRGMPEAVYVDLHVRVPPQLPTLQAHQLAHEVEHAVMARFDNVVDVTVHVEPQTLH